MCNAFVQRMCKLFESETGPFRSEMQDVFVQQTTLTVPASHAEHGEDYVIEWQDPVMEKHVRKWLDRPKGDIYHSDVWDYQRVSINSGTGVGDLIVKDAPDGVDIGRNVNSNEQLAACAVSVEGTYDPVTLWQTCGILTACRYCRSIIEGEPHPLQI